ncbi:MAG TPA: dihydrolipoamide acetyltransferase family protein [Micropruina sp.]|nr:dihydrolipoamide acetyltransferase family protein [Micropruina sp.]
MASLLRMPGVSADADTALLESWSVAAGDSISRGAVLATVETDKAMVEIEAESDAVVHTLLVDGGSTVAVGDPIAVLSEPGEDASAAAALAAQLTSGDTPAPEPEPEPAVTVETIAVAEDMQAPDPEVPAAPAPPVGGPATARSAPRPSRRPGERIFSSPLARRLAKEYGLELSDIAGTGPANRITKSDVEAAYADAADQAAPPTGLRQAQPAAAVSAPSVEPGAVNRIPHTRLRRAIASRLQGSKQNAPHFYLTRELDLGPLLALRAEINDGGDRRVSVNDLLVKAAGLALQQVPECNVSWTEDELLQYGSSDVAVAVASDRGLVTPVIRGIETLGLTALSAAIKDAAKRAGEGRLQQKELEGGSLTVSNLGMFDVDEFAAILNPPQSTILAIGSGKPRPWVDASGQLTVATTCRITASFDHRAIDGALGAQYLQAFSALIAHPIRLLL